MFSMVDPHPKPQRLPNINHGISTSVSQPARGHTRLRSLTLAKTSLGSLKTGDNSTRRFSDQQLSGRNGETSFTPTFKARDFILSPSHVSATHPPQDFSIDFLSSQVLPKLVPSVKIGQHTVIQPENAPLQHRRSSLGAVSTSNGFGLGPPPASRRTKNHRNLSLPGILYANAVASFGVQAENGSPSVEIGSQEGGKRPASGDFASATAGGVHSRSSKRKSLGSFFRSREELESAEVKETERAESGDEADEEWGDDGDDIFPPPTRHSAASPIFENDETEMLDPNLSADSLSNYRFGSRRSQSPLFENPSPISPFWKPHVTSPRMPDQEESVVYKGSRVIENDEDYNPTIHCATLRPLSQLSRGSNYGPLSASLVGPMTPTHQNSGGSLSSIASRNSSITSQGFRNMMASGGKRFSASRVE